MSIENAFQTAREVRPHGITGTESPRELIESAFPAFVGRQVRTGYQLMRRSIEVAGNYTAAAGFAAAKTAVLMGMSELCTVDVCVVASPEELSAVAEEKTILVSRTPPGWRSRIAQALRAVL